MFSKSTNYFFLFSLFAYLISLQNIECREQIHITPATTVFIFNFDTIVVTHEKIRTTFNSILAVLKHPWVLFLLIKPSFYRDVVHILTRNIYADGTNLWGIYYYINHFQKSHALFTPDVKEALLQALNAYKPLPVTFKMIVALKKSGYQVYITTNKDSISLRRYIKPHLKKYYNIDLDAMFDGYFCDNERWSKEAIYTIAESLCKNDIKQIIFFDNNHAALERIGRAHNYFRPVYISSENLEQYEIIKDALLWNKDEKRSLNE